MQADNRIILRIFAISKSDFLKNEEHSNVKFSLYI